MEFGSLSTGWLKLEPNVKWVNKVGSSSTGWLNLEPKVKCVIPLGKLSTGSLNVSLIKYHQSDILDHKKNSKLNANH